MPEAPVTSTRNTDNLTTDATDGGRRPRKPSSLTRTVSPPTLRSLARNHPLTPANSLKPARDSDIPSNDYHPQPPAAAVESGSAFVADPLTFWLTKLSSSIRPPPPNSSPSPRLSPSQLAALYTAHAGHLSGAHFVVHQHDHPVAGTHYDLRLQCNASSSVSFAIMYGLPGDPNSRRLNRNATETRVHCLWNHLVETASLATGSLLIWDTGVYEVLPYERKGEGGKRRRCRRDSSDGTNGRSSSDNDDDYGWSRRADDVNDENFPSQQEKLHCAFAQRKIRLRLHGTRLPAGYTICLRLTRENDRSEQPGPPRRKRRRKDGGGVRGKAESTSRAVVRGVECTSSSGTSDGGNQADMSGDEKRSRGRIHLERGLSSLARLETPPPLPSGTLTLRRSAKTPTNSPLADNNHAGGPRDQPPTSKEEHEKNSEQEEVYKDEEETIRRTNAYPGASNTLASIHQRKWYLSMDRAASGYVLTRDAQGGRRWVRRRQQQPEICHDGGPASSGEGGGGVGLPQRFHVLGRYVERSVVTGRLAGEVLSDEGVVGFVPRGLWRGVTE